MTRSTLLIQRATPMDAGNYTCQPKGAAAAGVKVHVLQGKWPRLGGGREKGVDVKGEDIREGIVGDGQRV